MAQPEVCVVGAANIDLISYLRRLPRMGETIHGTAFELGYGGKGANQAVMAAKLGARVFMVTKVGKDFFGEGTIENFQKFGIETRFVAATDQAFSGVAPIMVDADGNNSIVIVTGANDLLTDDEINEARPVMKEAGVVVCQLEVPVEMTLKALRAARAEGATTILNPAPASDNLPKELLQLSDVLCPNQGEAGILTGRSVETRAEIESAAQTLMSWGARSVVITLGEDGCLVTTADGVSHVPGTHVDPVDTTGAGDAFVGSLAYFLAAGQPLDVCAARANEIAAISVRGRGTQKSFPEREQLPEPLRTATIEAAGC